MLDLETIVCIVLSPQIVVAEKIEPLHWDEGTLTRIVQCHSA